MTDQPTCTKCPAFLHAEESIRTGLCHGCRSPGPETKVDTPRDPEADVTPSQRIDDAVDLIHSYGGIDGGHHKQWLLDQVLQALLTPKQYAEWVEKYPEGPNGEPDIYPEWDTGTPP